MLRLAFDFIITWRETRTRPNAYKKRVGMSICFFGHLKEEKYKWGQVGFH